MTDVIFAVMLLLTALVSFALGFVVGIYRGYDDGAHDIILGILDKLEAEGDDDEVS